MVIAAVFLAVGGATVSADSAPLGDVWDEITPVQVVSPQDRDGWSVDIDDDGDTLIVGAPAYHGRGREIGRSYPFDQTGTSWSSGPSVYGLYDGDQHGTAVAMSGDGNVVVVGVPERAGGSGRHGRAEVYRRSGGPWTRDPPVRGAIPEAGFGSAVAISADGHTIAVGSQQASLGTLTPPQTRVYRWTGRSWDQLGAPLPGGPDTDAGTTAALSADGSTVVVGSPREGGAGTVRVFDWTNDGWVVRSDELVGRGELRAFGHAVAISADGDTIAVGEPRGTGAQGRVTVYDWQQETWIRRGADLDNPTARYAGRSVALSADGTTVAFGAPNAGAGPPSVRVDRWVRGAWQQRGADLSSPWSDLFGWSVALNADGSRLVIGGPGAGVFVYRFVPAPAVPGPSPTDPWVTIPSPSWPGLS